jgi:hypothetical protein
MSVPDAVSGLLASLLAIDLINSAAYSATAPAVLGASTAHVIAHTGVSQPTVRAPIPASILPLLPPLPPGVLLEAPTDGLRADDACALGAAASLVCCALVLFSRFREYFAVVLLYVVCLCVCVLAVCVVLCVCVLCMHDCFEP